MTKWIFIAGTNLFNYFKYHGYKSVDFGVLVIQ